MHHQLTAQSHPSLVEELSESIRQSSDLFEPRGIRTFTPSRAVISSSAGSFHWTPEGRRLLDYTSGVLVANLGHNPTSWMNRFFGYMGWDPRSSNSHQLETPFSSDSEYVRCTPMTTYNAITDLEVQASESLLRLTRQSPHGQHMEQVLWAASGSEAVQKAIWAAMAVDRTRPMILATRYGFHGKKGLANAVTGSEVDSERDPRVRFISFPMHEYSDVSDRGKPFHPEHYLQELEALVHQYGSRIGTLITEPYLGGGGSYHPPQAYLQLLEQFCRKHGIVFILDEVQANFGRTGRMFAYEKYAIAPDLVVLGKGLGNGVPVAAVVGSRSILSSLQYGEASDTWSANPLNAASVLATIDCFQDRDLFPHVHQLSQSIEAGLCELKQFPFVRNIRGEENGMVWGIEMKDHLGRSAAEWANDFVYEAYRGSEPDFEGVHLLGPLAKKVVRVSPPLTMTQEQAQLGNDLLHSAARRLADR